MVEILHQLFIRPCYADTTIGFGNGTARRDTLWYGSFEGPGQGKEKKKRQGELHQGVVNSNSGDSHVALDFGVDGDTSLMSGCGVGGLVSPLICGGGGADDPGLESDNGSRGILSSASGLLCIWDSPSPQ